MTEADAEASRARYAWCGMMAAGFALTTIGAVWLMSKCGAICECNHHRCCEYNHTCPKETPCSCLSNTANFIEATCEFEGFSCESNTFAEFVVLVGISMLLLPLFQLCIYPLFAEPGKWIKDLFPRSNLSEVELEPIEATIPIL